MLQQVRILYLQVQVQLNLIIVQPLLQVVDEASVLLYQVKLIDQLTQTEGTDEQAQDGRRDRDHTINHELTIDVALAVIPRCAVQGTK